MRTKILLLFAIFFCVALASNAQINTGRYLLGGSFNIYNAKNFQPSSNSKFKSLNANIQFGKVVKENTVVGLILSYGYSNYYYTNTPDYTKINQSRAGIFYRKYKGLAKDFYFFGEVDAAYSHTENTQAYFQNGTQTQGSKSISDGGSASFVPGISYAVGKRMQIELLMPDIIQLSYSHIKTDYYNSTVPPPLDQKGNIFSFNTNLNANLLSNFGIGFKFFLGK
jgi:hypothetical protein